MLSGMWDHPNANKRGEIKEHIYVMGQKLNRKLVKGENVHHKNGVRDDNHIDNLELWYKPQPGGQRVTDLIDYLESTGYEVRKR